MNRVYSLLIIYCFAISSLAQTQHGVAYRYNGKNPRTPLANVTISYDANKRTTISSEDVCSDFSGVSKKLA